MTEAMRCPKCGKAMAPGYVPDIGHNHSWHLSTWVPGTPKSSWWMGLKKPSRETRVPVRALRCEACGFLEFYARPEFGVQ